MRTEVLRKQFFQYIIPSMFTMLLSGFYAIVDGLFVGNAAGDSALGAINLVWPIQCLMNATAMGIGVGSAVLMSTYMGEHKRKEAQRSCGLGLVMLLMAGVILPLIMLLFLPQLLQFFGAEGELYTLCKQYIVIVLIGGIFPMIGNGINPLLRNRGNTMSATLLMSSGLITNILLDYIFVFVLRIGIFGAGLATILAQAVVAFCSFLFLWKSERDLFQKDHFVIRMQEVKKIMRIGISPFGQTLVPSLVILFTNWKCIAYGGAEAVTIFSVVSYVLATVQLLLQGIGDGVQPMFSFYYGAKKHEEVRWMYRHALMLSIGCSLVFTVVVCMFGETIAAMFGIHEGLREASVTALSMCAISFLGLGIARLTCSYFYATGKHKVSSTLVYLEPCLIMPLALEVLSLFWGMSGVWLAYPIAQIILCLLALWQKHLETTRQTKGQNHMVTTEEVLS